jgi:hypothetical protein
MVEVTKIFLGIFSAIGVLALTALVLYLIARYLKKYKKKSKKNIDVYPGSEYMEEVGARCPSGWIYQGTRTDKKGRTMDVCHNAYNVPVCRNWAKPKNGKLGCYSDVNKKIALFPTISSWKDYLKGDVSDDYRCKWINRCGPPSEIGQDKCGNIKTEGCDSTPPAAWDGIAERC